MSLCWGVEKTISSHNVKYVKFLCQQKEKKNYLGNFTTLLHLKDFTTDAHTILLEAYFNHAISETIFSERAKVGLDASN